jgi:hypothetical protein
MYWNFVAIDGVTKNQLMCNYGSESYTHILYDSFDGGSALMSSQT